MYNVQVERSATKVLEQIPQPYYRKIKAAILDLADNPRPNGYIKLTNREAYRIRIGVYRIVYEIHDKILLVQVIEIGHRKDIYK